MEENVDFFPNPTSSKDRKSRNNLPPTMIDRLIDFLPDTIADHFRTRQRQLVLLERRYVWVLLKHPHSTPSTPRDDNKKSFYHCRLQRKFLQEYRSQCKAFEPVLKERGTILGETILDAFMHSGHGSDTMNKMSYAEALARSLKETPIEKNLPLRDVVNTLDPLLTPVLTPFVEGLKEPINGKIDSMQREVILHVAGACVASAVVGFFVGRVTKGKGGGWLIEKELEIFFV